MNQENNRPNPLGVEPIPKLLMKYALPSVVSMLVMSLYNIVDQIFIGRGVGYLGNTATTVAFPLTTVGLALALLIGNGSAAFISLEMGRGQVDKAKQILSNAVSMLLISGIVFAGLVLGFLEPVLNMLGATADVMPYAIDYSWIIMLGMPFVMFSTAMASVIRADGDPRFSMISTLVGAVINVILDPIFIFVFNWGVTGAAIATVIGQVVSAIISLVYICKYAKYARFVPTLMRPQWKIINRMAALGSASFVTQSAITVVNIVLNNALRYYGGLSPIGSEIPLAAVGIVMKINGILISTILGIVIGAQPILGFNYGAENYGRVRKTFLTSVTITGVLSLVCTVLFITMPEVIVSIFGDESPDFNQFAAVALSTMMSCVFAAGIQIPSANYFQAVGKPLKAMTLSMSRQLLILVPMILILPLYFGLNGILYAAPVADIGAFCITSFFILREMRQLSAKASQKPNGTELPA